MRDASGAPDDSSPAAAAGCAAIVLAGGRATRLGGASKALLRIGGRPALARVVGALLDAWRSCVAVVGPAGEVTEALEALGGAGDEPHDRVLTSLERDRFGGPAVAVAAGVAALAERGTSAGVLVDVLACDLRRPGAVVAALDAATVAAGGCRDATTCTPPRDGVVLVDDDGREQWLACRIRFDRLAAAVADAVPGAPLRRHLGALDLVRARAPRGATLDLDTPADLAAAGAVVHHDAAARIR